jgi:lysophospholipase L1-like esterase
VSTPAPAVDTPAEQTQPAAPAEQPQDSALSKSCQPGAAALADETALPNVAAALAKRNTLKILAMGAAPGRVRSHRGDYTNAIETMLERALRGTDVLIVNRGVSGELATGAAIRMRNEVALEKPDLVLWQVGTNDALAYVPVDEFASVLTEQIAWLKSHHVDVVLVGLQFTRRMTRDEHYVAIREKLRTIAAQENVPVVRFYEAMQLINGASQDTLPAADEFERNEEGYNCLAQYVARAIAIGVFGKAIQLPKPADDTGAPVSVPAAK